MQKPSRLSDKLHELNRFYFFHNLQKNCLILVASLFLSVVFVLCISHFLGFGDFFSLSLGGLFFLLCFVFQNRSKTKRKEVLLEDFALYLETKMSKEGHFFESYKSSRNLCEKEERFVTRELKDLKNKCFYDLESSKKGVFFSFLFCLISFGVLTFYDKSYGPFSSVVLGHSNLSFHLEVVEGLSEGKEKNFYKLGFDKKETIRLTGKNLVKLKVLGFKEENLSLVFFNDSKEVFQSFLFEKKEEGVHEATFSLEKSLDLTMPELSKTFVFAHFQVAETKEPKAFLTIVGPPEEPHPSHKPLKLQVNLKSEKGLSNVYLHLKTREKNYSSQIGEFSSKHVTETKLLETIYLDQYASSDEFKLTLVVEAQDQSSPTSLQGFSNQISLNIISAYGEYRRSLLLLKELRISLLDLKQKKNSYKEHPFAKKIEEVFKTSRKTPYFDFEDRFELSKIGQNIGELSRNKDYLDETISQLNKFLEEHEALDDRERDRDFFVAIRAISFLFEKKEKNKEKISQAVKKVLAFLDQRFARWQERTKKIRDKSLLPNWDDIQKNRPFAKVFKKVEGFKKAKAQESLGKLAGEYEFWLSQLEEAEDKTKEKEEALNEKELVSIRKSLKELQKVQGEISLGLDGAENKQKEELKETWPLMRLKQNTNLAGLKSLTERLRSLNIKAGKRLEAAKTAMEQTKEFAEKSQFRLSEKNSDLAGRFLREAITESQKKKQKGQKRRRKRIGSDKYYGQAIHSGDIKIRYDYEINKEYREDILNEVERETGKKDHNLLDRYLKKIIR